MKVDGNLKIDQCRMYDVNYDQLYRDGQLEPNPEWPIVPCKYGFEFNFTDIPYPTIATEVSLHPNSSFIKNV